MKSPVYAIRWNTNNGSGELPITYISLEAALIGARDWEKEMVAQEKTVANPATEFRTEVYRIH